MEELDNCVTPNLNVKKAPFSLYILYVFSSFGHNYGSNIEFRFKKSSAVYSASFCNKLKVSEIAYSTVNLYTKKHATLNL